MSLRYEQYEALRRTREFLRKCLHWPGRVSKKELREQSYQCLRHFPPLYDNGEPMFSNDNINIDKKAPESTKE